MSQIDPTSSEETVDRPASVAPTEPQLETLAHDPYAALRYRTYLLYSIGWMFAVIGGQVTAAAMQWEVYSRLSTHNPTFAKLALGFVAGVQALPMLLLTLPAGAMADRIDRRRIVQVTLIGAMCCSLTLAALSYREGLLAAMFVVLAMLSACLTLGRPARSALLPNLVPQSVFANAITWNASAFQVASMTGPALGGFIIHWSLGRYGNVKPAYIVDAFCSLMFILLLGFIRKSEMVNVAKKKKSDAGVMAELAEGIHFVRNTKIILATITLDLFAVLLGGAVYLLPVFAKDILHVGSLGFGWLRAADAIGAFTMALVIAHLPPMKNAGRNMLLAVVGFGAATIVFGISRNFWLSFVMLFFIGAFDNISVVVRHTLVQVLTPDQMRGRVSAVNAIFIGASNELGGLESGTTAALFSTIALALNFSQTDAGISGPTASVVFGGVGTIITVLVIARIWPEIRKIGKLQ